MPTPTPVPGQTVEGVVFYDENGDGTLSASERVRVPAVEVAIGSRSTRSGAGGQFRLTGVAEGSQEVGVRSAPPFYQAGVPVRVQVPQPAEPPLAVPVTLPIGNNAQPNVYMAFGDSITAGEGASAGAAYPDVLLTLLGPHFGAALVTNRGADATNSFEGVERVRRNLRGSRPAYTLILYGTNDWNIPGCQDDVDLCRTVENLRLILDEVKAFGSLPVLATLLPVNPAQAPPSRNAWIDEINPLIASMGRAEGAFVIDVHQTFRRRGDLASLYTDHVHLNDAGYSLLAQAFFEGIAFGREVVSAAAAPPGLAFLAPGT